MHFPQWRQTAADGGLTVRPTTPSAALIEQLTQNDAQRMSAAQEDPEEIVDIFVELKDVPLADRPVVAFSANAVASVQKQLFSAQSTVQTRISRALPKEHVEYTYSYTVLFTVSPCAPPARIWRPSASSPASAVRSSAAPTRCLRTRRASRTSRLH